MGRLRCAEVGRLRCAEVGRDLWADELLSREALRDRSGVTASMKRDATCFTAERAPIAAEGKALDAPCYTQKRGGRRCEGGQETEGEHVPTWSLSCGTGNGD